MSAEEIKILVIDDDPGDCRLVKLVLKEPPHAMEFAVETAKSLAEGLNCLKSRSFDLVLLDLGLPDSRGLETVNKFCRACPHIAVVVLTGLEDEAVGLEAIKKGASDYLAKGRFDRALLVRAIRYSLERERAEEGLKQAADEWRTTFNSITDLVSIHDKDFKLVRVNKAFADAVKMEPAEVIGKTCYELVHGTKEPPASCPHKQTLDTKEPHSAEFFEPHLGIYLEASTSPIFDENGEIIASVHITKDITERKCAEERQATLFEEVERINQELKDFAYIVSHDLKAPLRGVKTLADWISADYADKLGDKGREQMELLLSRVMRMHNLIDGVLEYSRVGREKEEQVQINLNGLVREVIDMVAPPENIEITIENELPVIECERTRIMQVFQNLLSNAVKYMDKPQGRVRIGCVEEDGFWKFSVADNGSGIEEKYFERIFKMFQTLSPRDEFESTGVGLTVVKKIVELYDGRIWVESEPGKGSTFFFTLPKKEMGVKDAKHEANIVSRR